MLPLLAQVNRQQPGAPPPNPAELVGVCGCYLVVFAVLLVVQVLFLRSVSRCLQQVAPRNREMEPGQVWLNLIPLFGAVWIIITVLRVSDSLRKEYDDRGLRGDDDYGKTTGLVYTIGMLVCGLVGLVGWIMYWIKIAGYTRELESDPGYGDDYDDRPRKRSRRDDDDEYDDDRPRGRGRRDDEYDDDDRPRRR